MHRARQCTAYRRLRLGNNSCRDKHCTVCISSECSVTAVHWYTSCLGKTTSPSLHVLRYYKSLYDSPLLLHLLFFPYLPAVCRCSFSAQPTSLACFMVTISSRTNSTTSYWLIDFVRYKRKLEQCVYRCSSHFSTSSSWEPFEFLSLHSFLLLQFLEQPAVFASILFSTSSSSWEEWGFLPLKL